MRFATLSKKPLLPHEYYDLDDASDYLALQLDLQTKSAHRSHRGSEGPDSYFHSYARRTSNGTFLSDNANPNAPQAVDEAIAKYAKTVFSKPSKAPTVMFDHSKLERLVKEAITESPNTCRTQCVCLFKVE